MAVRQLPLLWGFLDLEAEPRQAAHWEGCSLSAGGGGRPGARSSQKDNSKPNPPDTGVSTGTHRGERTPAPLSPMETMDRPFTVPLQPEALATGSFQEAGLPDLLLEH